MSSKMISDGIKCDLIEENDAKRTKKKQYDDCGDDDKIIIFVNTFRLNLFILHLLFWAAN